MTSYVDVEFYKNEFLQGRKEVIPFSEFEYWSNKATTYIKRNTFGRVEIAEEIRDVEENKIIVQAAKLDEVKRCACEIAEAYFMNAKLTLKAKRSESVGEYSVSYDFTKFVDEIEITLREILHRYLSDIWINNVNMLFRG